MKTAQVRSDFSRTTHFVIKRFILFIFYRKKQQKSKMADNFTDNEPIALPYKMVSHEIQKHMLGWNIPAEHQHLVHEHWRQFPDVDKSSHYLLALIYTILTISSVTGNGLVIWIFSTSKSLRTPSNMFVINLAIFDLAMMGEMPHLIMNSFYQRMLGYELGCDIYAVLGSLSGIGGSITNAVIAYDRYKTISSPIDGRINRAQATLLVICTWLYALPFTVFPLTKTWGRFVTEGFLTTCSFDFLSDDIKTFVLCIAIWSYVIPMSLICTFYLKLFGAVRHHERMLKEQAKKMNVKSLASNKEDAGKSVEIRIAKVAFTIFFLFICSWTPYGIVAMIGAFGDRSLLTPVVTMIPAVFCKAVSCLDPWVYAINHPRFRVELEKRVPWMGVREPDPDAQSSTGSAVTNSADA
ncbi:opsin-3-like [Zerene cesonia]|uniref:opsin-3-like n=1 Tax=Zerene cesonia TaxID=33412 RepID=UPI0018E56A3E|nr:opsin-3-like [Zerene cesonia]